MENFLRKNALLYFLVLSAVFLLDLLTKELAERYLSKGELSLLSFLHLVLVYNTGAAFGILSETKGILRFITLILVPFLAVLFTFWYTIKKESIAVAVTMGAIAGGALGNLYDRIVLGYVRDFIYLQYGKFSWPAFNVADMSITIAIFAFFLLQRAKKH